MTDYYCENCEFFEDKSTDKLIDGYCKKYNQSLNFYDWWEKCDNCVIETLKAENAALRERLEKAVELPVKVGDTVWLVGYIHVSADAHLQCIEAKITDLMMMKDLVRYGAQEGDWCHEFTNDAIGEWVFMTREAAEACLVELKGEKE